MARQKRLPGTDHKQNERHGLTPNIDFLCGEKKCLTK